MGHPFRFLADARGVSLVAAVLVLLVLAVIASAFFSFLAVESETSLSQTVSSEAFFLADAGMEYATAQLAGAWGAYVGETDKSFGPGEFDVSVFTTDFDGSPLAANRRRVLVVGCVPDCDTTPLGERSIEVIVRR